jgi:hypothetical protein
VHDVRGARGHHAPATRGGATGGGSTEAPKNHGWRRELEQAKGIASGNMSTTGGHRGVEVSMRDGGGSRCGGVAAFDVGQQRAAVSSGSGGLL